MITTHVFLHIDQYNKPCLNGGECMNRPECTDLTQCKEYYCDCKKGWSGEKCEISTLFRKYYLGNKDEGIY